MRLDCHTHTGTSPDGEGTVRMLCEQAARIGLEVLTVTEHVEMNRFFPQAHYNTAPRNEWEFFDHEQIFNRSLDEIRAQQPAAAAAGVNLLCGMEMGQPYADVPLSQALSDDPRLDFIIASLHELPGREDFFSLDYSREDIPALLDTYFTVLYHMTRSDCFDVLGHLTYPLRYITGEYGVQVELRQYEEKIRAIFRELIDRSKGLELNTSGLRQKYGKTFPHAELLQLYHDMGGEILTIGSDAHRAADLGSGIEEGLRLAQLCGFHYICYFKKRMPVFVRISAVRDRTGQLHGG